MIPKARNTTKGRMARILAAMLSLLAISGPGCRKQKGDERKKGTVKVPDCKNREESLTASEKATLVTLARRSLESSVRGAQKGPGQLVEGLTLTEALRKPMGVFVTLNKSKSLRGCIGYLEPVEPLYKGVISNAASAALRDTRFRPVTPEELKEIDVEISVLSVPVPVDGYEKIEIGCHGIIMEHGGRRATFLPHVATERKWDRETTLRQLSFKGWRRPDIWEKDARFQVYTAQVFSEHDLKKP